MRPIKFRAIFDGKIEYEMSLEGMFAHYENGSCKLDQFTGLLDRKGKEIYEGDILKVFGEIHIVKFGSCTTPMGFGSDAMFYFENIINKEKSVFQKWSESAYEIIGNIHENGDLLCKNS